ncbi:MAG TPA: thioredoxin-dependent thiol peroxidase [Calditrichaeota bacterium]|nr:thioredoxin-dependent thiol peroxidase [Calditrichota bacterium]
MLKEGTKAPDFALPDQNGEQVRLSDFSGQWVVLYFYPKDMTPGCTTEACNFQTILPQINKADAVVLGVSKDSVERHKKFADKHGLIFKLLSDAESDICEKYGVWQKKKLYGKEFMGIVRSTFIIDPKGIIVKVYPKVKVKEHHRQVLFDLEKLKNSD